MPRFYPPASLAEHCVTHHGFEVGRTVTDQVHRADHQASDRVCAWLAQPTVPPLTLAQLAGLPVLAQLSAVLPIRHAYTQIGEQEVQAA